MRLFPFLLLLGLAGSAPAGHPVEAQADAWADAKKQPAASLPYLRYLYLGQLEENGSPRAWHGPDKKLLWQVVAAHVNLISLKRDIVRPPVVVSDGIGGVDEKDGLDMSPKEWDRAVLIRLNIYLYGWDPEVYERLRLVEPHFHLQPVDQRGRFSNVRADAKEGPAEQGPERTVWVDRGPFTEVKLSEVREGEKVYERVEANAYREVSLPPPARGPPAKQEVQEKEAPRHPSLNQTIQVELEKLLHTDVPLVMADFFWWQTSIQAEREPGPGYYDFLRIKNEADFQRRVGFDPVEFKKKFAEFVRDYRAAVAWSGVARQPRRIMVEDTLGGKIWVTFDSRVARGLKNPLDIPDDRFDFEASREMGHGANGLIVMGLFAKGGTRQDSAPDFVGPDSTSTGKDGRIHIGQCLRCHSDGFKSFEDWYENSYRPPGGLSGPDAKAIIDVQQKYHRKMQEKLVLSRAIHQAALKDACGLTTKEHAQAITDEWFRYQDDRKTAVGLKRAAMELGTSPEKLQAALRGLKLKRPGGPAPLQGIRVYDILMRKEEEQQSIPIDLWHDVYGELQLILSGARP